MNKYTNTLLVFILAVVLINLALTVSILTKQEQPAVNIVDNSVEQLDSVIAKKWGEKVKSLYNQQDHQALYALFDNQAKVKISHQQLQIQLNKLYRLFGEIQQSAFISADKIGEKNKQVFYRLIFNVRVQENNKRPATLTLSVIIKGDEITLYGIRLNGSVALD
ncbi:hypothetical protein GCM10007916_21790 [Psychromonas marina]|uniref:DUF4019 domain-containing protein n=1 Tax=Psychromonas marina TaxID=88364 RepID=A0ABQ6E1P9_9GAMM|nr:hypothetical protein [Psychromonas marina]GLS91110.1 hypothetical protein GCM10007916_21790 [Psychromonas marina]